LRLHPTQLVWFEIQLRQSPRHWQVLSEARVYPSGQDVQRVEFVQLRQEGLQGLQDPADVR